ncbi:MAG: extracellular solute-binding protein [Provencibacterium sp.]|jgi:putative aldouronate transport system substrate-binding protein|nr:extracellular solute-binding protein [Provencibacterium sp.]
MKKGFLALTLSALLVASVASGCVPQATSSAPSSSAASSAPAAQGGSSSAPAEESNFNESDLPIVNDPVTVTIAAITGKNKDFKELEYFIRLEEMTNVNVNWNMSSSEGWDEKKSLLFASGDLPDAFYGQGILSDIEVVKYASQEVLIPLSELMEKYCPNFMHVLDYEPKFRPQITVPDGEIYSLPSLTQLNPTTHSKFFLNKVWLDNLGLEVPETIEEFQAVLQAFKDNDANGNGDPNDEIPFTFRAKDQRQQNLSPLFGSFGQLDDYTHFIVKDGKVVYTAVTEPYKEAIKYFHELYSKGLLDQEGFTHDSNVYVSKIQDPSKICGGFLGWSRSATGGPNKEDYVAVAPLKGPAGVQIWKPVDSQITSKGAFAITKSAEHPEILMRWIDVSYDQEFSLEVNQGLLGRNLEKTPEGGYRYLPVPEGKLTAEQIHDYGPGNNGVYAVLNEIGDKLELNANLQERKELDAFYAPYNVPFDEVFPNVLFDVTEADRLSILKTDIDSYVEKNYAGWISNGGIDEDWDGYLKQLENMKLDEYIQLHQQAYDRYVAATKG